MAALRSSSSSTMPPLAEPGQGQLDHADRALDDPRAGGDDGAGLLPAQHRLRDLRCVREVADPDLHDLDAGQHDPLGNLLGQLAQRPCRWRRAATSPPRWHRRTGWVLATCRSADSACTWTNAGSRPRRSRAVAVSATCQTTIAAISTGLPSASLTLSRLVSKFLTRTLIVRRTVSGSSHAKPACADRADVAAEEHAPPASGRAGRWPTTPPRSRRPRWGRLATLGRSVPAEDDRRARRTAG